jgi:hypothetical protein
MKPEQLTDFKRELASVKGECEPNDLYAWAENLFKRYELAGPSSVTQRMRRHCQDEPVPIASSHDSGLRASGYLTYTGNPAYLYSSSSINVGWCPTLNVLLYRWESWTNEDTYLRIPGSSSLRIKVMSAYDLADRLYWSSLNIIFTPDELDDSDAAT